MPKSSKQVVAKRSNVGINVTLPARLHRMVKIRAAAEQTSLEEIVRAALILYTSRDVLSNVVDVFKVSPEYLENSGAPGEVDLTPRRRAGGK